MVRLTKSSVITSISMVIGILGIILSIYFYYQTNLRRIPIIIFDNPTEVFSSQNLSSAPIKVIRSDGKLISSNLYISKFYLWNEGKQSIKPDNVLEPISFRLSDTSGEIIDAKIISFSRPLIIPRITISNNTAKSFKANISFNILEDKDGFAGQILFTSSSPSKFIIEGAIEGAKQIRTDLPLKSPAIVNRLILLVICLIVIFSFILILYLFQLGWSKLRKFAGSKIMSKLEAVGAIFFLILIAAFVSLLCYSFFTHIKNDKSNIPHEISQMHVQP